MIQISFLTFQKGTHNIEDKLRQELIYGNKIEINPITYDEIKRGLLSIGANKKLEKFEKFCNLFGVGELTLDVLNKAVEIYGDLRSKARATEDADLLIAAFCVCNQKNKSVINEQR